MCRSGFGDPDSPLARPTLCLRVSRQAGSIVREFKAASDIRQNGPTAGAAIYCQRPERSRDGQQATMLGDDWRCTIDWQEWQGYPQRAISMGATQYRGGGGDRRPVTCRPSLVETSTTRGPRPVSTTSNSTRSSGQSLSPPSTRQILANRRDEKDFARAAILVKEAVALLLVRKISPCRSASCGTPGGDGSGERAGTEKGPGRHHPSREQTSRHPVAAVDWKVVDTGRGPEPSRFLQGCAACPGLLTPK